MKKLSLGLIETVGLCAAIEAADAALKSANVTLLGYELSNGGGMTVVKLLGEVSAVNAAIAAASVAASKVNRIVSTKVIARPADRLEKIIYSANTVGVRNVQAQEPQASPLDSVDRDAKVQVQNTPVQEAKEVKEVSTSQENTPKPASSLKPSQAELIQEPIPASKTEAKQAPTQAKESPLKPSSTTQTTDNRKPPVKNKPKRK